MRERSAAAAPDPVPLTPICSHVSPYRSHTGAGARVDRFFSHFILKLDAKGRVSVPAPFRAVLTREGGESLFCYPALGPAGSGSGRRAR